MTPPAHDRLDALLAKWAAAHRLDQRVADEVLAAIVAEPQTSLPATWWSDLSSQVTAAVVLANARPGRSAGFARAAGGLAA